MPTTTNLILEENFVVIEIMIEKHSEHKFITLPFVSSVAFMMQNNGLLEQQWKKNS